MQSSSFLSTHDWFRALDINMSMAPTNISATNHIIPMSEIGNIPHAITDANFANISVALLRQIDTFVCPSVYAQWVAPYADPMQASVNKQLNCAFLNFEARNNAIIENITPPTIQYTMNQISITGI